MEFLGLGYVSVFISFFFFFFNDYVNDHGWQKKPTKKIEMIENDYKIKNSIHILDESVHFGAES